MSEVVAVIMRCNLRVEDTRSPVAAKSAWLESNTKSVSNRSVGVRLVINARITWRCGPIGSVRHTAGRAFAPDKSSNGKGTRTTLPLVMEWLPVGQRVNIFFWLFQKIESRVSCCCSKPFTFVYIGLFGDQDDNTDAGWSGNGKLGIQMQLLLFINCPCHVERFPGTFHRASLLLLSIHQKAASHF